jgi:hypothetical protein
MLLKIYIIFLSILTISNEKELNATTALKLVSVCHLGVNEL